MSLNLNAALSSFIAASPRLIHHSKTLHWKKKKKTSSTDLSRDQNTICVWTQYSNSCSSSAGRLVYGPTIREWATYVFIYLFIFTLRYVIAPFRYLSRPLISAALAPALCVCDVWWWERREKCVCEGCLKHALIFVTFDDTFSAKTAYSIFNVS